MPRIALALIAVVTMSVTGMRTAAAGQRCVKRPDTVLFAVNAQLDETGHWYRRTGDADTVMKSGHISDRAVERVERVVKAGTTEQAVRCLDSLIADETSSAATKACKVAKR